MRRRRTHAVGTDTQDRLAPAIVAAGAAFALVLLAAVSLASGPPAMATTATSRAPGALAALEGRWPGRPADDDGRCAVYPYEIRIGGEVVGCTHGPDPIPDDVRAAGPVTLAELRERTNEIAGETAGTGAEGGIPCIGDGSSGLRAIAIYAHLEGTPSRHADVAPMIRTWAAEIDRIIDVSAGQTGGSRHLRWQHDATCNVTVVEVTLSDEAVFGGVVDPFTAMVDELIEAGFDRYDRRYLVWVDASSFDTMICGVAMTAHDESPGTSNIHNGGPSAEVGLFGRVDRDCWGRPAPDDLVEAHELVHTLGAVQPNAPYSSSTNGGSGFYGHCIDEWDTMCYDDGTPKTLIFPCPQSQERLLDCRHDTYFHTNPPAGSYLAERWNPAMNAFLVRTDPVAGFTDVGSAFRADIAWLAESGITTGCSADRERFCPTAPVTRGQMASFLSRALDLPPTSKDFFTDDAGSTHQVAINRVAAAGITTGCTATTYCPRLPVTRGQMAAFLHRALV